VLRASCPLSPRTQLVLRVGYRALVEGAPVYMDRLAQLAGLSTTDLEDLFSELPGFVRFDSEGRVVGLLGLCANRSLHRFDVVGQIVSTWCAWDSLFIPRVMGMSARVASHCPVSKRLILLVVTPDGVREISSPEVTVSFVVGCDAGMFGACCSEIHFLGSVQAARVWQAQHPNGLVLTIEEAWEVSRVFVDEVLFGESPSPAEEPVRRYPNS
jgi:alkylmercury lyase